MVPQIKRLKPSSNQDMLNAIRLQASNDYQRRIPAATKANIQEVAQSIFEYEATRNEAVNALVNRIGLIVAREKSFTNPLAKFKIGELPFGDTIEEVMVGLLEAQTYDPHRDYLERDLFGQASIDVQSSFHKVNRQDFYKVTINDPTLRKAFLEEQGLYKFVGQLMDAPMVSDQWDEFLLTVSLFREYHRNGGFFKVGVPDVAATTADANDAKQFLRRAREFADTLPFISSHYNAAGMPVAANRDDLELFITPEANSAIDVEALAGAFNTDRANMPMRTTVIPKEHFGIAGAQAILSTKDFFVIADQRFQTTSQANPVGLYENHFLHRWQVVSASRFVPAILFTSTETPDVITLVENPVTDILPLVVQDAEGNTVTDVERGQLYSVTGSAVTTPAGGVNDAVRFELDGSESQFTYINQAGTLSIGSDEDAETITIVAIATDNNTVTETLTVDVQGDKVQVWPNPDVIEDVTP